MLDGGCRAQLHGGPRVVSVTKKALMRSVRLPREVCVELWDWLSLRRGRFLAERMLEELGFLSLGGSRQMDPGADQTDFTIRRLVFSSGKDVRVGERGFLASADDRGGHRSFWPTDFYTMDLHRAVGSLEQMLELSTEVESDLEVKENESGLQVEIVIDAHADTRHLDNMHRLCTLRMDHFF